MSFFSSTMKNIWEAYTKTVLRPDFCAPIIHGKVPAVNAIRLPFQLVACSSPRFIRKVSVQYHLWWLFDAPFFNGDLNPRVKDGRFHPALPQTRNFTTETRDLAASFFRGCRPEKDFVVSRTNIRVMQRCDLSQASTLRNLLRGFWLKSPLSFFLRTNSSSLHMKEEIDGIETSPMK